jgi:hypothetical protein
MGLRDEEQEPTEKQKHQAALRKQLFRAEKPKPPEKKEEQPRFKGKGKHRKR